MKHIHTFSSFINEAQRNLSMEAAEIHQITGCGQDAAQDFIDDNNLDGKKLVEYLRKNNKMTAYDVRDFIAGSGSLGANKAFRAKFIKQFLKESVNEAKDKADAEINKLEKALSLSAGSGVFKDVEYDKKSKTLMLVQPTDISPLDAGAVLSAINREKKKLSGLYPGITQVVLDKLKITI